MKLKSVLIVFTVFGCISSASWAYNYSRYSSNVNPYFATDSRYDYLYANPPKPTLRAYGRYFLTGSRVRYVHSPSRRKGIKHAARINAYNMAAYGY